MSIKGRIIGTTPSTQATEPSLLQALNICAWCGHDAEFRHLLMADVCAKCRRVQPNGQSTASLIALGWDIKSETLERFCQGIQGEIASAIERHLPKVPEEYLRENEIPPQCPHSEVEAFYSPAIPISEYKPPDPLANLSQIAAPTYKRRCKSCKTVL